MAMSANSKAIFEYLQGIGDADVTAKDVAATLGLSDKTVNGAFTSAIQRKGYGVRVEAEIELEDSTHKKVKFLKLTDEGKALDLNAADAE